MEECRFADSTKHGVTKYRPCVAAKAFTYLVAASLKERQTPTRPFSTFRSTSPSTEKHPPKTRSQILKKFFDFFISNPFIQLPPIPPSFF